MGETLFQQMAKFNPNHEPAGSPKGGQFAPKGPGSFPIAQAHPETLHRFSLDGGKTFTTERQRLHDSIINSYFKDVTSANKPESIVLGGGPAAGKSVLRQQLPSKNYIHIDPDDVKTRLPEFAKGVAAGNVEISTSLHEESSLIAKKVVARATDKGYNLIIDGTGDNSYEQLAQKVAGYRADGRRVIAKYVTVDADTAVERALARGKETGRYVPEAYSRQIHKNVSTIFERALSNGLFDQADLFDTNGPEGVEIASAIGNKVKIYDHLAWQRFLAKAQTSDLIMNTPFVIGGPARIRPNELHNYLAAYGQEWKAADLPPGIRPGKPGDCYKNATELILSHPHLRYAEGVAYTPAASGLPFMHAWAVTPEGTVIDPTWERSGESKYFGVVYNHDAYIAHALKTKFYGVLGGEDNAARAVIVSGGEKLRKGKKVRVGAQ